MLFSVEELSINDSFILYCLEQDAEATEYWKKYLEQHPDQLLVVEEAKYLVLGLRTMFRQKHSEIAVFENRSRIRVVAPSRSSEQVGKIKKINRHSFKHPKKWVAVASIIFLVSISVLLFLSREKTTMRENNAPLLVEASQQVFSKGGELKTIVLNDGTKVTMNALSELRCSKEFGTNDRNVYLKGEALFDVAHNKELSFIVHLSNYKVKAVGTVFNVKAYSNDEFSETSLLEGKVQILANKDNLLLKTLDVKQKIVVRKDIDPADQALDLKTVSLAYDNLHRNLETAWIDDYLIFENQTLDEIKNVLERRFNISIVIKDNSLRNYKYTAAFKNEKIEEILKALQLSYPFTYQTDKNKILLMK